MGKVVGEFTRVTVAVEFNGPVVVIFVVNCGESGCTIYSSGGWMSGWVKNENCGKWQ